MFSIQLLDSVEKSMAVGKETIAATPDSVRDQALIFDSRSTKG